MTPHDDITPQSVIPNEQTHDLFSSDTDDNPEPESSVDCESSDYFTPCVSSSDSSSGNEEDGIEEERTFDEILSSLFLWKVKHNVSERAFRGIMSFIKKNIDMLHLYQTRIKSTSTLKRQMRKEIPQAHLKVCYSNNVTGEETIEQKLHLFPRTRLQAAEYDIHYEIWKVPVKEVMSFHFKKHEDMPKIVSMNVDGVPIGRTGKSQTIVSIKFESCRNVYQLLNAIPRDATGKGKMTPEELVLEVLEELVAAGLTLKDIICDAPMRAFLRRQLSHAAKLACDYCFGEATSLKFRRCWLRTTFNKEKRTMERLQELYTGHDSGEVCLRDYGYLEKCFILDAIPNFNIIDGILVDPMHLCYLGVSRALFELTFKVGQNRERTNKVTPRLGTEQLDEMLLRIKVPAELTRKPRAIDFKNYKAQEFRNLVLVYFPALLASLPYGAVRNLWVMFIYLLRAYSLPDKDYETLDKGFLGQVMQKWYYKYQKLFGPTNMRYNVHVFTHCERIRQRGSFPTISAFPFEGAFAFSTRAQEAGTSSIGLQSLEQSYYRSLCGHVCEKTVYYSEKETTRSTNKYVYDKNGVFYEITSVQGNNYCCRRLLTGLYSPLRLFNFNEVGCAKFSGVEENETLTLHRNDFEGKAVVVPCNSRDKSELVIVAVSHSLLLEAD